MGQEANRWFALQVKNRWERSTAVLLNGRGYETLVPTFKTKRRWGSRTKVVETPLFPGYVICSFDVTKRLPILMAPGVISVVSHGRIPTPLESSEVSAIQALVSSGLPAEPWPYLEVGQRVRVESDALRGVEGILIALKGSQRIVISVTLLRRSIALEIDRAHISPICDRQGTSADALPASLLDGAIA